jgi:hypothetical protein
MQKVIPVVILIFGLLSISECFAAKYLLLKRLGRKGSIEFTDGEFIRYQLKGADSFQRSLILGFSDSTIIFRNYEVAIKDIAKIDIRKKSFGGFRWNQLGLLSILSGGLFLVIDSINNEFTSQTAIISSSLVGGGLILALLKQRYFKISRKHKIEIINL